MEPLWHDAFYRFTRISDPDETVQMLEQLATDTGLLGSILVAEEGINGMLAGSEAALATFREGFEADPRFNGMIYKRTFSSVMPFKRLKVKRKREIVPLGIEGVDATACTGVDVSPADWRELIRQPDVVLLDNRNSFEYRVGHFKGAVDPGVTNFADFPQYVQENLEAWQDKRIAMYCTGGIRCEKTTAWLAEQGLTVYQLEGGILNYFAQLPDAHEDYEGSCFVFDERVALDTHLQETGLTLEDVESLS